MRCAHRVRERRTLWQVRDSRNRRSRERWRESKRLTPRDNYSKKQMKSLCFSTADCPTVFSVLFRFLKQWCQGVKMVRNDEDSHLRSVHTSRLFSPPVRALFKLTAACWVGNLLWWPPITVELRPRKSYCRPSQTHDAVKTDVGASTG